MNELSNVSKLEVMMMELVNMQKETINDVKDVKNTVNQVKKRVADIENNYEITTQQRTNIRRTVTKQVYKLLGLPEKRSGWSIEHNITMQKYSQIFHQRCYSETAKKGHLGTPYGTTTTRNYVDAIKDIEAWTPNNGIGGLMKEADDNALARLIANNQGYN